MPLGKLVDSQAMKRAPLFLLCSAVVLSTASTTGGAAVRLTPPQCSAADTMRSRTLWASSYGQPVFIRFCGHARADVRVNGKLFRIRGGKCFGRGSRPWRPDRRELSGIAVGFIANRPASPGLGITFFWRPAFTRPARVRIDDSEIEFGGGRIAASGTVVVGPRLRSGTFRLYGRTAAGPTGEHVTGRWTCG